MDSVEDDAQGFLAYTSRRVIQIWETLNGWTLEAEHKRVLEEWMLNPYAIAQGLDELRFEYNLLHYGKSRSCILARDVLVELGWGVAESGRT